MTIWVNGRYLTRISNCYYFRRFHRIYPSLISTQQNENEKKIINKPAEANFNLPLENEDPSEILSALATKVKQEKIEPAEAINALNVLKLHANDMNTLKENVGFKVLCNVVGSDCPKYSLNSLLSCLKTVLTLNLPPDSYIVQSLQTEVIWKMRKMNYRQLVFLLRFHLNQKRSKLECKIVENATEMLERRWVEIDSLKDVANLLTLKDHFNKQFLGKLEIRTIELIETAAVDDLCKLFVALSELKYRPIPLLRSMAFHLTKEREKFNVKQATDVLCAMNSLKFPDHVLLGRLSEDLISEISSVQKASIIGAILTNVGQIKWKSTALMDSLSRWILSNVDKCQPQHLASYIITAATLNYVPSSSASIFDKICAALTEKSITIPDVWLDVVYSLVLVNKAKVIYLVSVLNPAFEEKITNPYGKIKLATISAFAKFEHPNYKQPLTFSTDLTVAKSKAIAENNSEVLKTLYNFVPKDRFMKANKMVLNCLPIEAEFVVDSKGKAMPLADFESVLSKNEPLPSGYYKIALIVRHFKDYLINSQELTGGNGVSNKLLEKLNYRVVEVPYSDFDTSDTTLKRVQYLQNLISKSISDK